MTIAKSFMTLMESLGYGSFGVDLFKGGVSADAPDACWWVISSGGNVITSNKTGEKVKKYIVNVFYRNIDAEDVDEKLQEFEELINGNNALELDGYETIEMEAMAFPSDQDLDVQDRTIGLVQIGLTIYK